MHKQTNTLSPSPSPKCFQSPSPRTSEKSVDSDSDVRKALAKSSLSQAMFIPWNLDPINKTIMANEDVFYSLRETIVKRLQVDGQINFENEDVESGISDDEQ
jgi:hypothetical protein